VKAAPQFLSARDLCARWGIGRATLARYVNAERVPPPVRFGARCVRWPLSEVLAFEGRLADDRGVRQ
jgi:predicted DNA-binding transcriptional regulator AlpA